MARSDTVIPVPLVQNIPGCLLWGPQLTHTTLVMCCGYSWQEQDTGTFLSLPRATVPRGRGDRTGFKFYVFLKLSYSFGFCWIWNYTKVLSGGHNYSQWIFKSTHIELFVSMYKVTQWQKKEQTLSFSLLHCLSKHLTCIAEVTVGCSS